MKTRLIIGMFAAMWICAACEKVEIINESDGDESGGMKDIVMHVGGDRKSTRLNSSHTS